MKTIMSFILIMLGMITGSEAQNKEVRYSVTVNVKGLPDGTLFYFLKRKVNSTENDTIQRVLSKNESVVLARAVKFPGELHFIKMDTTKVKLSSGSKNWLLLILDQPSIKISSTIKTWPKVTITGSPATLVYDDYFISTGLLFEKAKQNKVKFGDYVAAQMSVQEAQQFDKKFFKDNYNSIASPFLLTKNKSLSTKDKEILTKGLSPVVKNSFYMKKLEELIAAENSRKIIGIGKRLPDFEVMTPQGEIVTIKNFFAQNKFTLIDFWASWCSPCRAAIPHLKEVYTQFKNKGFNIVGVSSDKNQKAWKKALTDDGTAWSHGISVDGEANKLFQIEGIPSYILVDGEGKIVASAVTDMGKGLGTQGPKITGEELTKTIEKLLGNK